MVPSAFVVWWSVAPAERLMDRHELAPIATPKVVLPTPQSAGRPCAKQVAAKLPMYTDWSSPRIYSAGLVFRLNQPGTTCGRQNQADTRPVIRPIA